MTTEDESTSTGTATNSADRSLLHAFADLNRIRILAVISLEPRTTPEIATMLDLPINQVGKDLSLLGKAGLLQTAAGGRVQLSTDRLDEVRAGTAVKSTPANEDIPSGLRQFFRDSFLISMPAKRSLQLQVLAVLIEDFKHDRDYPEAEVNQIIIRRNPDYATIRRDFIDELMMTRRNGIYRRI